MNAADMLPTPTLAPSPAPKKPKKVKAPRMIASPADAADVIRKLCHKEQETFVVVSIDVRNNLIAANVIAMGTAHSVEVHPRDVFREAVRNNAAAIVLGHNHPSGNPNPSREDLALTERLKSAGALLGIPVIDHVVVCHNGTYRSISELGV